MSPGFEGGQFQTGIYLSGGYEWPLTAADWEAKAREKLAQGPFDYVAGCVPACSPATSGAT